MAEISQVEFVKMIHDRLPNVEVPTVYYLPGPKTFLAVLQNGKDSVTATCTADDADRTFSIINTSAFMRVLAMNARDRE